MFIKAPDGSAALHAQRAVAYRELLDALGIGSQTARAASVDRLYDFLRNYGASRERSARRSGSAALKGQPKWSGPPNIAGGSRGTRTRLTRRVVM